MLYNHVGVHPTLCVDKHLTNHKLFKMLIWHFSRNLFVTNVKIGPCGGDCPYHACSKASIATHRSAIPEVHYLLAPQEVTRNEYQTSTTSTKVHGIPWQSPPLLQCEGVCVVAQQSTPWLAIKPWHDLACLDLRRGEHLVFRR